MIEKLKIPKSINWDDSDVGIIKRHIIINDAYEKINELIDAVNVLQLAKDAMFNAIRDIQNRITALEDPTYHEEAQDMYDNAILDALKDKQVDVVVEPADPYAEQRHWIGKLCRFRDNPAFEWKYGILEKIYEDADFPFWDTDCYEYVECEPVKPDDDIIYKGE